MKKISEVLKPIVGKFYLVPCVEVLSPLVVYTWGRDAAVVAMTLNYVEVVVEDYRDAVKVLDAF